MSTSLEHRLRNYGRVLERHIEGAPLATPQPQSSRRRGQVLRVAAAVVVTVIVGAIVLADQAPTRANVTVLGSASAPAFSSDLVARCIQAAEASLADIDDRLPSRVLIRSTAEIVVVPSPVTGFVRVEILSTAGGMSCRLTTDGLLADQQPTWWLLPLASSNFEPATDSIVVIRRSGSTESGSFGPGYFFVFGRAGSEVSSVELELPDGTTLPSVMADGWFVAEGRVADVFALFQERLTYTLTSGEERSHTPPPSANDLFADEVQQCAPIPGCLDELLDALMADAASAGAADLLAILEDRQITRAETQQAFITWQDCRVNELLDEDRPETSNCLEILNFATRANLLLEATE